MGDPSKVLDVRDVLQKHSYTTTLEDLRSRGRERVRVIHADQIAAMIEEAVLRTLGERKTPEEVEALVQRSREEFKRVIAERQSELETAKGRAAELERVRSAHASLETECEGLRRKAEESERARADLESRSREPRLVGEPPARDPAVAEMLGRLERELACVRETLAANAGRAAAPAPAAAAPGERLGEKIEGLARALGDRIDRIGRKVGVSSAVEVEVGGASLEKIFGREEKLESNLDDVQVKERRAEGIAGALEKARSMRRKGGSN